MFSYNEYKNIIRIISENLPILDFTEVKESTKKFCVLRHDIEFSIDRAYKLAKVESEIGISSSYTKWLQRVVSQDLDKTQHENKSVLAINKSSLAQYS